MSSAIFFNLDKAKILSSCNGLTCHQMTKFLDLSKLKAFADDKSNIASNLKFNLERVENIQKKRRKCWLPAFSPFPARVSKGEISKSLLS